MGAKRKEKERVMTAIFFLSLHKIILHNISFTSAFFTLIMVREKLRASIKCRLELEIGDFCPRMTMTTRINV